MIQPQPAHFGVALSYALGTVLVVLAGAAWALYRGFNRLLKKQDRGRPTPGRPRGWTS